MNIPNMRGNLQVNNCSIELTQIEYSIGINSYKKIFENGQNLYGILWDGNCESGKPEGVFSITVLAKHPLKSDEVTVKFTGKAIDGAFIGRVKIHDSREFVNTPGMVCLNVMKCFYNDQDFIDEVIRKGEIDKIAYLYDDELVGKQAIIEKKKEIAIKLALELKQKTDDENRRIAQQREYDLRQNEIQKQFAQIINNKDPQIMYLAAGNYWRNGYGEKAKQVYEAIISRFPSSNWAVKANDQLNDTKRSNDAESAASQRQYDAQRASREADSRSKSQCSFRIRQCENTCSGMKGDSWRRCNSGCQSLCSQF